MPDIKRGGEINMPGTLQTFLSKQTTKAAADLIKAVENLPEERRSWSPMDKGRSALDQAAECAILNGLTIDLLATREFPKDFDMASFVQMKQSLAADCDSLKSVLNEKTDAVAVAISETPDSDLDNVIVMPWGEKSVAEILAYPYWNMSYHEGQTNYISFLTE